MASAVAADLRARIHSGDVPSGQRFSPERELAQEFSVSRMTLREALKILQHEGYIEVRRGPRGGAYVTSLGEPLAAWKAQMAADFSPLDDIFDFRIGVEAAAARFAAQRRSETDLQGMQTAIDQHAVASGKEQLRFHDARFHETVGAAAQSPRLLTTIRRVRGELFLPVDFLRDADTTQHSEILDAIRAQDSEAAAKLMGEHIEGTRRQLRRLITSP